MCNCSQVLEEGCSWSFSKGLPLITIQQQLQKDGMVCVDLCGAQQQEAC